VDDRLRHVVLGRPLLVVADREAVLTRDENAILMTATCLIQMCEMISQRKNNNRPLFTTSEYSVQFYMSEKN